MSAITHYQLTEPSELGFRIRRFKYGVCSDDLVKSYNEPHRNSYYTFFILDKGHITTMIDFDEIELFAPSICCIKPTQVHRRISNDLGDYWVVAIDVSLFPKDCIEIFERPNLQQLLFKLSKIQEERFRNIIKLLCGLYNDKEEGSFKFLMLNGLITTFIAMVANQLDEFYIGQAKQSRLFTITSEFQKKLAMEFKQIKSPSAYAQMLNISESYLNEAIRKQTGYPVTYWIRQVVITEAKRLLCFSDLSIKEISNSLGYDNHYFSKIFHKEVGISALKFRALNRK